MHRPKRSALYDSGNTLVREKWLYYDNAAWGVLGARGLLTKEESRLAGGQGNTGNSTVTYGYDIYGNKTSTTDPLNCTTTIVYESSQTFPATVTNCLGHQTTTVYDLKFGVITSRTDPHNSGDPAPTTTWTYNDPFGRLTSVTGPLDGGSFYGTVTYQYLNFGNPQLQSVKAFRTTDHGTANSIWSEQFFDGLGRVDKTQQQGPGGQTIITREVEFDPRGAVQFSAAPRFETEAPAWSEFHYDVLGRQTQVTHPDGSYAQLVFDHDLVTSVDENGHAKLYFGEAYDRVIRLMEVNASATYVPTSHYEDTDALTQVTPHSGKQAHV